MNLIQIAALENGAHANRCTPWENAVPDGWALIPEEMELPQSYPFVDIEVADVDGVPTVTALTPREMPAAPAEPEPTLEQQVAALQDENTQLKDRLAAQESAMTDLQVALCELYETAEGGTE